MQTPDTLFHDYLTKTGAAQAKAAADLAARADAVDFLCDRLKDNPRVALALLARCAKKKAHRYELSLKPVDYLSACLSDGDAKTRKNAAVLLGALENTDYVPFLIDALDGEAQQFVRPSMILALGALGGSLAREALMHLSIPKGDGKHARAEQDAIQKAKSRLMPTQSRSFTALPKPMEIYLAPVSGLVEVLIREGTDKGFPFTLRNGYAVIKTADYPALFNLRCFYEALIPLAAQVPMNPKALAAVLHKLGIYDLLCSMHDGVGPFGLRLELRTEILDRGAFASMFFATLPKAAFINAPSSYDVELRAIQKDETATLMLRLYGFSDPRFSYRSEAVPASMHPTAAAAILYAHRDLMDPEHSVLDPFCGAGTLLIERARIMGARSLTGLDISPAAWRIARTNLDNACLHAKVFNRDCRGYTVKDKVHEIICNLPFGHRVGSHGDNHKLYDDVLSQWPDLLHENGFILAITNDKQLFSSLAKRHGYRIVRRTRFAYGGLSPTCFLLQR